MSPTNQDLFNDTTFSQIKSRVPVPLRNNHLSDYFQVFCEHLTVRNEALKQSRNVERNLFEKFKKSLFANVSVCTI